MPPKVKITKEEIIRGAVMLVREKGAAALNARAVATALDCSTQPVFSNFSTMDELVGATIAAAYEIYLNYIKKEVESELYPKYKAFGMAYVRFAKDERELFKLLFMCDRQEKELIPTVDFEESVNMIMKANGISKETAELFHLEMWSCVHGIGTMLATSFLTLDWELISNMITDVYQGLRARHITGGDNYGSN